MPAAAPVCTDRTKGPVALVPQIGTGIGCPSL